MSNGPFENVMMAELSKLLQQQVTAGLSTAFSDMRPVRPLESTASSGINIVIHNNAGAQVNARETQDPLGGRQLEITVDQMVARALSGGRETSGVMRMLFGLAPDLIGR